jgi:hypothetical protein
LYLERRKENVRIDDVRWLTIYIGFINYEIPAVVKELKGSECKIDIGKDIRDLKKGSSYLIDRNHIKVVTESVWKECL